MKRQNKYTQETKTLLFTIGSIFLLITPIVWILVPQLLTDALCTRQSCGYNNVGINTYALLIALVPCVIGIVTILFGAFYKGSTGNIELKMKQAKPYLLLASAALACITIYLSLSEFKYRIEPPSVALFLLGIFFAALAPAYYLISTKTQPALRVAGIIAFTVLLMGAGIFITAVLSFAFI